MFFDKILLGVFSDMKQIFMHISELCHFLIAINTVHLLLMTQNIALKF